MDINLVRDFVHEAHAGQVDKAGRPYHEHVEAVADLLAVFGEDAQIAGLLHDVIEDTHVIVDDLVALGISQYILDAVLSVTRRSGETYMSMIQRAATHPLGRLVKLADNAHNSSAERLALLDPKEASSLARRYGRARQVLNAATLPVGSTWRVC